MLLPRTGCCWTSGARSFSEAAFSSLLGNLQVFPNSINHYIERSKKRILYIIVEKIIKIQILVLVSFTSLFKWKIG
jgi:hypothetical protein